MKKANGFVQKRKTPAKRMKKRGQFILIHVSGAWPVPITTDKINAHAILREHPLVYSHLSSISRPSLRDVLNKKRTLHLFIPSKVISVPPLRFSIRQSRLSHNYNPILDDKDSYFFFYYSCFFVVYFSFLSIFILYSSLLAWTSTFIILTIVYFAAKLKRRFE